MAFFEHGLVENDVVKYEENSVVVVVVSPHTQPVLMPYATLFFCLFSFVKSVQQQLQA